MTTHQCLGCHQCGKGVRDGVASKNAQLHVPELVGALAGMLAVCRSQRVDSRATEHTRERWGVRGSRHTE